MRIKILFIFVGLLIFPLFVFKVSAKDLEDKGPLSKVTFIHYRKEVANIKNSAKGGGSLSCYNFLGKGVYWKNNLPRTLFVNTASFDNLEGNFVLSAIENSAETWDGAVTTDLFSTTVASSSANWDDTAPDGNSEIVRAAYSNSDVIAVANVWGYFGGPINTREIVDFDILFNSSFNWGDATLDSTKMDLQNIATHELGHGWGLGDIYQNTCSSVTMYGYSTEGETSKRTLEQSDITGIKKLYN